MSDTRNRDAFYNLAAALSEDVLRTPAYDLLAEAAEDHRYQRHVTDYGKVLARAGRRAAVIRLRRWLDALRGFFGVSQLDFASVSQWTAHPRRLVVVAASLALLLVPVLMIEYAELLRRNGTTPQLATLAPQAARSPRDATDYHRVSVLPFSGPSSLTPLF